MKYTREYLWKVFQEINRDKRKLTTDEILDLLKIVKEDYVEDFTNPIFSALDCLCYGSDYIETNEPLLFKSYFTQKLDS